MGVQLSKLAVDIQQKFNLPKWIAFHLLHFFSRIIGFWLFNGFLYVVHRNRWFMKYKIQGERMPNRELIIQSVKHGVTVDLYSYFIVSYLMYKWFTTSFKKTDQEPGSENETKDETKNLEKPRGWVNLRMAGDPPAALKQICMVMLAYFGYDAMFYWSHRLLHRKEFYLPIHKKHHNFHTPVGPSCNHEHIVESLAQLANWYVPLGLVGYYFKDLHFSTVFYYHCLRWFETVDAHCGYDFPLSPFHLLPFFGGAKAHDAHHRYFFGNYGATPFWDWLCGTQLNS